VSAPAPKAVLLPYQVDLHRSVDEHLVTVCEKSRRIGMTWGIGSHSVLTAAAQKSAGGMDVFYIGYNQDMTREYINTCAMWAKNFNRAASAVLEEIWDDGEDRDIKIYRIEFASGFSIVALCSRPRSLRGRQGFVILDEAAFHDELSELLKSAMALLMWGGRVLVISTHNGADNPFNELVEDCRAGRKPYGLLRVTFDDAVEQGLYERICYSRGEEWTAEKQRAWVADIVSQYGDAADEELHCIPRRSSGAWLPRALVERRMTDTAPVLRYAAADDFAMRSEHDRFKAVHEWLQDLVWPFLATLDADRRHGFGMDFGRNNDLSVIAPYEESETLRHRVPFLLELRNVPFRQQEQILFYVLDALPRFSSGAMDARGNGQALAEFAVQRYGERVEAVMLSESWYRDNTAQFKAAFEDGTIEIPRDADVLDDLRAFQVVRGIPRLPATKNKGRDGSRHGDAGMALLLSHYAGRREVTPIEFQSTGSRRSSGGAFSDRGPTVLGASHGLRGF